ncbi:hypothetical protein FFLO_07019 [Filobasidium floriforme]|uniref:RRM domain-containing protein n=1 Tax=Filobasidium floriforme TaxID=5210 RepID=A0A8K0JFS4_9TREE|nr:hypothetical protein FFLO_07019 [Filobasidium floriforme]
MSRETNQPCPTLYVNNIESKIKKIELRKQLYALFTPYGKVIDVVAKKGDHARGQAFIVFADQTSATTAMRALVGEEFYGRPLRIDYAKSQSRATLRQQDPSLDDPESASNKSMKKKNQIVTASRAEQEYTELEQQRQEEEEGKGKRERDGEADGEGDGEEVGGDRKRRKVDNDEDEDEEMEMDEDDEDKQAEAPQRNAPSVPTVLLASNLPQETTQEALANLFEQYAGYQNITLLPAGSTPTKSASVLFSSLQQAESVQKALDGFKLKPDWAMGVVVVPADALA